MTETPEETTVSETTCGNVRPSGIGTLRCNRSAGHRTQHGYAGIFWDNLEAFAPFPAPRTVTVDLTLPLRDRLTEQEREDLENAVVVGQWWLRGLHRTTVEDYPWLPRISAALDRADTGGQG